MRPGMPSVRPRTFAPRHPLERPAPACASTVALPPRWGLSTPFHRCRPLRASSARLPSRALRCHRIRASLSLGAACRLLRTEYDARAHPDELSILARERSSRSAAHRHQPMPVALVSRCVAVSRTGEPRLAGKPEQIAGRSARAKARRVSRTMSHVPSSSRLEHPGHRCDRRRGLDDLALPRRPRSRNRTLPRERRRRLGIEVPSAATEPLRDRAVRPVRARRDRGPITPPPWRHCSGARTPFCVHSTTACP